MYAGNPYQCQALLQTLGMHYLIKSSEQLVEVGPSLIPNIKVNKLRPDWLRDNAKVTRQKGEHVGLLMESDRPQTHNLAPQHIASPKTPLLVVERIPEPQPWGRKYAWHGCLRHSVSQFAILCRVPPWHLFGNHIFIEWRGYLEEMSALEI